MFRFVLVVTMLTGIACGSEPISAEDSIESELIGEEIIIATEVRSFDQIGSVTRVRVLDPATMQSREIVRDVRGGRHSIATLKSRAEQDWRSNHGVLAPALLRSMQEDTPIDVDLELAEGANAEALEADVLALGGEIFERREGMLAVNAAPSVIRQLGKSSNVASVIEHQERSSTSLRIAQEMNQAPIAVGHSIGWGVGLRAAIWELDGCIRRDHPDFDEIDWQPRSTATPCSTSAQAGHSTKVAGVFAADRGAAGTVGLYRGKIFDVDARSDTANNDMWSRWPQIVNASFTISIFDAKKIDDEVYRKGIFVFNGSANNASATATCWSFNSLCVGGYSDNNTSGAYSDDRVVLGAGYLNEPNNHREFPQVVGPWTVRQTANYSTLYAADSGTSYATPAVSGTAALLLSSYQFVLWERPALMRAVLMASAQAHPIIDGGRRIPNLNDSYDDRTGAGAPHGGRAAQILDNNSYRFRRLTPSGTGLQASFYANANERVRVVLSWDQCPGYTTIGPELKVDLDLAVRVPSMFRYQTETHTNTSFNDNWEIVELITQRSGNVEIFVNAPKFDPCAAEGNVQRVPMAIAWTKEAAPQPSYQQVALSGN